MLEHPGARPTEKEVKTVDSTKDSAVGVRVKRGMDLVGNVTQHGDLFVVAGSGSNYTVSLNNINGETCECKDWKRHGFGHTCKHIYAVTIFAARGCRRAPKPRRHR